MAHGYLLFITILGFVNEALDCFVEILDHLISCFHYVYSYSSTCLYYVFLYPTIVLIADVRYDIWNIHTEDAQTEI